VTSVEFLDRYREFETVDSVTLEATLAQAASRVSAEVYGSRYDEAHGLMVAHLLWSSPFGATLRLGGGEADGKSKYLMELHQVRREVAPRSLVT
jgi:hypothetical protein